VVTGGGGPSAAGGLNLPPILEPQAGPISFGSFAGFGLGIEWMIPTAVFTLPGLLLLLIGLAQVFGGFVWLPLARRSMRGDGRPAGAGTNRMPNA
jgi:hypothetical protein